MFLFVWRGFLQKKLSGYVFYKLNTYYFAKNSVEKSK